MAVSQLHRSREQLVNARLAHATNIGEVGLNKVGCLAAQRDREVCVVSQLSFDPFFTYIMQPVFIQLMMGESTDAEKELSEKRADTGNHPRPPTTKIRSRAARPMPRDSLPSLASHSFIGSSTSFASMISAASAASISLRQPLAAINVNSVIVSLPFNPGRKAPIGVLRLHSL
jgi:hydroxymethylpyrimidine/phosphomethylpyrimidine kinase